MNESRGSSGRGREPAVVDHRVPDGGGRGDAGPTGLASGLVEAPKWWPFKYTTPENAKRLKRQRAAHTIKRWLSLPDAPF